MSYHYKDMLNIASKLTPTKVVNMGRLWWSYVRSKRSKKSYNPALPSSISIEPTTSCNLRCPECPSGLRSFTRPTGMLQEQTFKKVIDELADTLVYLTFYFQGEPYLNPSFLDLVQYAHRKRIYTATSTNAHYLSDEVAKKTVESGLDRLIISIDGTTQETYQSYRIGGKLDKVIEGTKNVLKWKKELKSSTPHVIFQFLVVKPNEHQIAEVRALADELGVDQLALKTAQIYDYKNGSDLIPTIDQYSRYRKDETGQYQIKNKLLDHCWKMWHSCVITWDGKIVPCCFDKDATFQMGNMRTHKFADIWNSKPYRRFRENLFRSRSSIEMCTNCTEGTKVWSD